MSFLSGYFSVNKKSECKKEHEISDKWALNIDPVRILLFKESGLRGRKLTFDSSQPQNLCPGEHDRADSGDLRILIEMVFGSVTSRCYGTYFKIHSLSSPNRVIVTQVFQIPFPKKTHLNSTISLQSMKTTYTQNSLDSQLSLQGHYNTQYESSVSSNSDSAFTELSFPSETFKYNTLGDRCNKDSTFSSNSSYNGTTTTSLNDSGMFAVGFAEDYLPRKYYNMGLVFIFTSDAEREKYLRICMQHVAFVESVIFRVRQNEEEAYNNPEFLPPTMAEMSSNSAQWLISMFSRSLLFEKENEIPIQHSSVNFKVIKRFSLHNLIFMNKKDVVKRGKTISVNEKPEIDFGEFCELLKKVESKEKKLFMSTLVTAALTHHLGWVATCYNLSSSNEFILRTRNAYNSLWTQMAELCGATGCPMKSARTIISASKESDLVSTIVNCLNYFIRYRTVEQTDVERVDIKAENSVANAVCLKRDFVMNSSRSIKRTKCSARLNRTKSLHFTNFDEAQLEDKFTKKCVPQEEKIKFTLGGDEEELLTKSSNSVILDSENSLPSIQIMSADKINDSTTYTSEKICDSSTSGCTKYDCYIKLSNSCSDFNRTISPTRNSTIGIQTKSNQIINTSKMQTSNQVHVATKIKLPRNTKSLIFKNTETDFDPVFKMSKHSTCNQVPDLENTEEESLSNNNIIVSKKDENIFYKLRVFTFPLPRWKSCSASKVVPHASTLISNNVGKYVPDMVIQGATLSEQDWMFRLKRDVSFTKRNYFSGYVEESVAVVGNVDKWDVHIISSYICAINRTPVGVKMEISSLVADMLEVMLEMWNSRICRHYCTTHMEQRLLEICIRSSALAQLLIDADFCTMGLLTATLKVPVNDVPLLMSVISTITPQVTRKYGLSFR